MIVLVVALLVLGPGKLPEAGAALGRGIRDFRNAFEGKDELAAPAASTAAQPAPAAAVPAAAARLRRSRPRATRIRAELDDLRAAPRHRPAVVRTGGRG